MSLVLSVLDQSPVGSGSSPARALQETVELASFVDSLGFHRYWLAEHHGAASFAGLAPEVLVATIAANTSRLRVGSGGVLLPRYDPVKVAEVFHVLAGLYPGRVDLGIGRAGGPSPGFGAQVGDLLNALADLGAGEPSGGPQVWLLGSSTRSVAIASAHGLRFCFGHFLNPGPAEQALGEYRQAAGAHGEAALAVRVFVAPSAEHAQAQAQAYLLWRSRKDLGANEPLPSMAQTALHRWNAAELARAEENRHAIVVGDPAQVMAELTAMAETAGTREVIVNTLTHDHADRLLAYRLLAETMTTAVGATPGRPRTDVSSVL